MSSVNAHLRPLTAGLLAGVLLISCTHYVESTRTARETVAERAGKSLRVTRSNGERIDLDRPHIVDDSLRGSVYRPSLGDVPVAIPLDDIRTIEVRRFSAGRTALLVGAIGITAAIVIAAANPSPMANISGGPSPGSFSCPQVYSWDGKNWRLDSGTYGGAIAQALQRTDVDNLDFAAPADGVLRLKLANELDETDYVDALHVIAVDHVPGFTVAPDPDGHLHLLGMLHPPTRAVDFRGRDALARVRDADGWNWESIPTGRDAANVADLRDGLILTFAKPRAAQHAHLVVDANNTAWSSFMLGEFVRAHGDGTQAWYDALDAHPADARAFGARIAREAFLNASVWTGDRWTPQGLFWEAGPEIVKRQTLDLDLSGVQGDTVRIRLESVPSFWTIDRVALDFTPDSSFAVHDLAPARALDSRGRDVRGLIGAVDHSYYTMGIGDEAELLFRVPPLAAGLGRTFLVRSTGWYRIHAPQGDGDPAMLRQVAGDSLGIARASAARLNVAIRSMARGAP